MSEAALQLDIPIGGVPTEHVVTVWPKVEPILKRVVKPQTGWTLDHVLTALQLQQMQLFVIGDFQAAAVTSIQNRPLHRVLWIQFIAGERLDEWIEDWKKVMEHFARHNDCTAIEFAGRRGWNHIHKSYPDYRPVLTTFRKEL